jgi:acyl-CoA thioester hydrolase
MKETARVRVTFADTDAMGVAYYGTYFRWFEIARTELMRATGLAYRGMVDRDLHLPVIEASCRYRRSARYDDLLSLRCAARPLAGVRLRMDYEILADDELLAEGHTLHAFTDGTGKPVRPPRDIRERLAPLTGEKEASHGPEE